jgi:hypothetical protein
MVHKLPGWIVLCTSFAYLLYISRRIFESQISNTALTYVVAIDAQTRMTNP